MVICFFFRNITTTATATIAPLTPIAMYIVGSSSGGAVGEGDGEAVGAGDGEIVGFGVGVGEGVGVGGGVGVGLTVGVGVREGLGVGVGVKLVTWTLISFSSMVVCWPLFLISFIEATK